MPIIYLITYNQIITFLKEDFDLVFLFLAAKLGNLLMTSSKQSRMFPAVKKEAIDGSISA